jgi:succinate dehydrogenase subunit C
VRQEQRPKYPVFVPKQSRTWWLKTAAYRRFTAREITSMFAAIFSGLMIAFLFALGSGRHAYQSFLRFLETPGMLAASAAILAALLYHTATWFRLTTHIIVIRLGRRTVSKNALLAALVAAWIAASAVVAYFLIWF